MNRFPTIWTRKCLDRQSQILAVVALAGCSAPPEKQQLSSVTSGSSLRVHFPGVNGTHDTLHCWYVESDPIGNSGYACWSASLDWREARGYGLMPTLGEFRSELQEAIVGSTLTQVTLVRSKPQDDRWMAQEHPGYKFKQISKDEMDVLASVRTQARVLIEER